MPYSSTESAVPASFYYFPPFGAKPLLLGFIRGLHLLSFFGDDDAMCLLDDVGLVEEYGVGHHVCNAQRVCALVVMIIREIFQQQSISISWESLPEIDHEHGLIKDHFLGFP